MLETFGWDLKIWKSLEFGEFRIHTLISNTGCVRTVPLLVVVKRLEMLTKLGRIVKMRTEYLDKLRAKTLANKRVVQQDESLEQTLAENWRQKGFEAAIAGLSQSDNPLLRNQNLPIFTGESQEEYQEKVEAWNRGFLKGLVELLER